MVRFLLALAVLCGTASLARAESFDDPYAWLSAARARDNVVACPCDCADCTCNDDACPKGCTDCPTKVAVPADGQLSPRGQWQWSTSEWKWRPVQSIVTKHAKAASSCPNERCGGNGHGYGRIGHGLFPRIRFAP